jgi:hypothetical protein
MKLAITVLCLYSLINLFLKSIVSILSLYKTITLLLKSAVNVYLATAPNLGNTADNNIPIVTEIAEKVTYIFLTNEGIVEETTDNTLNGVLFTNEVVVELMVKNTFLNFLGTRLAVEVDA